MLSKLREQYIGSVFLLNHPNMYVLCKMQAALRSCATWEGKQEGWGKSLSKDAGVFFDIDCHVGNTHPLPWAILKLLSAPKQVLTQSSHIQWSFSKLPHNSHAHSVAKMIKSSQLWSIWRISENGKFRYNERTASNRLKALLWSAFSKLPVSLMKENLH